MQILKKIISFVLICESRLILAKYKPYIVAVTGSVGKTSTKDAIYEVLKNDSKFVRKSEKSMNSEIGLPLTIIGAPNAWHSLSGWLQNIWKGLTLIFKRVNYPDCLVVEVGADHPGDIRKIAKWLRPDIAVITKISRTPVHVEFFKSPEEVFEEKSNLAVYTKNGGTVILFADDEKVLTIADKVKDRNINILTYGFDEKAMVRGLKGEIIYDQNTSCPTGMDFSIAIGGENYSIKIKKIIGDVYMYPILAGLAVIKAKDFSFIKAVDSLSLYEAPKGRMNIVEGINGSIIIDDTYNSSPDATIFALKTLKDLNCSGKKIAVLGDMMELGKYSHEEHCRIGKESVNIVSILVTVGSRSLATAEEAIKNGLSQGQVHSFESSTEAGDYLRTIISNGDIVLVKGSQAIRMEKAVKAILKNPDLASELLVRQEREWLMK